ncbi:MAG: hypothetical protein HY678_01300, partial [Chloroflexi bacterium]|nr:hypothetical protein [Chloroflexota bacterium]
IPLRNTGWASLVSRAEVSRDDRIVMVKLHPQRDQALLSFDLRQFAYTLLVHK